MKPEDKFWYKWMLNYSFGELLGIGAAAIIGRFILVEFANSIAASSSFLRFSILIVAGAAEGLIIGYIQWKSLSKLVHHLKPRRWILTTMLSTIAGWLLVLPPAVLFVSFLSKASLISDYNSILYTLLIGMIFGCLIGIPQFFIIRKFYRNAIVWIPANMVAWMLSFLVIYFSLSMIDRNSSFTQGLVLIGAACILSGLIQGLVTGTSLHFTMGAKKEHKVAIP